MTGAQCSHRSSGLRTGQLVEGGWGGCGPEYAGVSGLAAAQSASIGGSAICRCGLLWRGLKKAQQYKGLRRDRNQVTSIAQKAISWKIALTCCDVQRRNTVNVHY